MNSNANNYDATVRADSALDEESFLEAYSKTEYPKPAATADIAVFRRAENGFEVLLIRRGNHPFKGCWALPGGFVDPGEDVIDAAARELEEETGIEGLNLELFGIYGAPGRDPRGWTVSGGYCTLLDDADFAERAGPAATAVRPPCEPATTRTMHDGARSSYEETQPKAGCAWSNSRSPAVQARRRSCASRP